MTFKQILIDDGYMYGLNGDGEIYVARLSIGHLITEWELLKFVPPSGGGVGAVHRP